ISQLKIINICLQGAPTNVPSDPKGLQLALEYLEETYGNLPIYVQENGMGSADGSLDDRDRVAYLRSYMESTLSALRNGAKVRGYFAWAFM
ncbi:family 1 glycosylhydrolase, partial [Klebsiella pneumoniae]|uniref:family 1 glycosylhydrolase n=1 Tax=Klebsiella pneumoniae TaxID=573 RepID=UPI00301345C3